MTWLLGMLILLPVKVFHFPFNLELVDFWILMALPVFWLSFLPGRQTRISLPYTFAVLLILIGSFASTFAAPNPSRSIIVILKEIYLFVWFVTVTALLSGLNARDLRRIMIVWAGTVILHGLLIISQFLFPDIWRMTTGFAGQATAYAHFRPSGLFISEKAGDANKAAFFQLLGFVPLVLAKPSKRIAIFLGILLFSSILATGSMGTTISFTAGLLTSLILISAFGKNWILIIKYMVKSVIVISLFVGLFSLVLSRNQNYKNHFEKIITGRAEKSSGGRFDLWQRGMEVFEEHNVFLWGVGPENFREVDAAQSDNQLHNDFLAFTVERGLIGFAGLMLFAIIALGRAVYLLLMYRRSPEQTGLVVVVFPAIIAAMLIVSLTHQIFHAREMWLVLALQEAMVFKIREVT
jgi:O-antigen ligase